MKLTYFHYNFLPPNQPGDFRRRYNITDLLEAFCLYDDVELKNSFEHEDGEKMYLLQLSRRGYLFLATRQQEIIKALNARELACEDIQTRLEDDETVSFASYLHFDYPFYALCSTQKGPKHGAFVSFMNQLLQKLRVRDVIFKAEPLFSTIPRSALVRFPHIGRTTVEVDPQSSLGSAINSFLTRLPAHEVQSYEITIKPKRRASLSPSFIEQIEDEGLKKFVVRAKASLDETLDDFYITAQGALHDTVTAARDGEILHEIARKVSSNENLSVLLHQLEQEEIYVEERLQSIDRFRDTDYWSEHFLRTAPA